MQQGNSSIGTYSSKKFQSIFGFFWADFRFNFGGQYTSC